MKYNGKLTALSILIAVLSAVAASWGIFSSGGPGTYEFISIHGSTILIYGKGVYQHMSAEVAPQGIAQDVVTLFIGIPLLLLSLWAARKELRWGKVVLTGTLGYFLVTYLFFTLMAMFNQLFLVWVFLLSASFFGFITSLNYLKSESPEMYFSPRLPTGFIGGFLIFNAVTIALLWLSVVAPPVFQGMVPATVEHYTTLVVQALDLAILLPASFIAGWQLRKKTPGGFLLAPVYMIFLTLMMSALTAKIIAMGLAGYNVIPAIFIIPAMNLIAISCTVLILKNLKPSI